jgi:hypothetical protein
MLQSKDLKRKKFSWMVDSKLPANPSNQQVDQNTNADNHELSRTDALANDGYSSQMCNHNADDNPSSHAEPTSALISTIGEISVDNLSLSNMPSMDKLESSNFGNSESCDENQTCNKSSNLTVTPCDGNGVSSKSADTAIFIEIDNIETNESSTSEKGPDWTQINASWFEPSPAISLPQSTSGTSTTAQQTLPSLPVKRSLPVTTRLAAIPRNNKQLGKATNKAAQQNNSLNDDDDFDVASAWNCGTNVAPNEGKTERAHTTHEVATFQSGKSADDFNIKNAGNYNITTLTHNEHPTSERSSNNSATVRSEATVTQETIAVKHSQTDAKNSNKQVMGASLQQDRSQNQDQINKINKKAQTITASDEPVLLSKANSRESSAVSNKVIQKRQLLTRPEDHVQPIRSTTDHVQKDANRSKDQAQLDWSKSQVQMDRSKDQAQLDQSKSQVQMDRSKDQAQVDRSKSQAQVDRSKNQAQVDRSKSQVQVDRSRSQVQVDRSKNQEQIDRFQDQRSAGRSKDQTRPDHQLNGTNTGTNISPSKSVHPPYTLHASRSSTATKQSNFPSNVAATNKRNSDMTELNSTVRNGEKAVQDVRNGTIHGTNQTNTKQFIVNDAVSFHSYMSWSDDEMPPLEHGDTLSSNVQQSSRSAVAFLNSGGKSNNGYPENEETHNGGYPESGDKHNGGYPKSGDKRNGGYAESGDKRNGGYAESGDKRNGGYAKSGERGNGGYLESERRQNVESGERRNNSSHSGLRTGNGGQQNRPGK